MNRNTIILLVVLAAVGVGGLLWWRRRQQAQAMVTGYSAGTPSPQANLAALQAPGAPFGLTGVAGQVATSIAGLLPPVGAGITAPFMPQNEPKLTTVWSNPAAAGMFTKAFTLK